MGTILDMLEGYFTYLCDHAVYAHFFLFGLLILAGINIPISEDLVLLMGGVIVAICVPENYFIMLAWLYVGCIISAYEAYWLGRLAGPKLYTIHCLRHFITPERVAKLSHFIERFGIFTFIIGRFIPGGVRNGLFMTSGLSKMRFRLFIFRDGLAAMLSTLILFQIGFLFGENYGVLFDYVQTYHHLVWITLGIVVGVIISYLWYHKKTITP